MISQTKEKTMTHNTWKLSVALTVLAVAGLAAPVLAQQAVPFRGIYRAKNSITPTAVPGVLRVQDEGTGHALHLGNSAVTDDLLLDARVVPSPVSGTITFTAANGDQVFAKVTAMASPPDAKGLVYFTGSFVISGGTGRFRGATGGAVLQGINNAAAMTTEFRFSGTIAARGAGRR
jgi:hypothetical protein